MGKKRPIKTMFGGYPKAQVSVDMTNQINTHSADGSAHHTKTTTVGDLTDHTLAVHESLGLGTGGLEQIAAEHAMKIIVLEADANITPESYDKAVADTMSDTTGHDNTIDTENTTSDFNIDEYSSSVTDEVVDYTDYGYASGTAFFSQITASVTGNVSQIKIKVNGGCNGRVALFEDNGSDTPSNLLNESSSTALSNGWNSVTIPTTAVVATTKYFLASVLDTTNRQEGKYTAGVPSFITESHGYNAFNDPAGSLTSKSEEYCLAMITSAGSALVQTNNLTSGESSTITKVIVVAYGTSISGVTVDISCDNGSTFTSGSALNTEITSGFGTGDDLILKFNLSGAETLKTYAVLYWT